MRTTIISAFPGTGKTYFTANNSSDSKVVDLDSHRFTLGHTKDKKVRNADFPDNYMRAIREQLGQADILFVSTHQETRSALQRAGINFILIYPEEDLRAEYIARYRQRRNPESFIDLIATNWSAILEQLRNQQDCKHVVLKSGQYISDVIAALL